MIKFLIEYLNMVATVILGIIFLVSFMFSIFGPALLAPHYDCGWWLLLYILTLPYLGLIVKKFDN